MTKTADVENRRGVEREDEPKPGRRTEKATREIKTSKLVAALSSGLQNRTPNSVAPKIAVLARIANATPGPLLKYAGARRSDHIQ